MVLSNGLPRIEFSAMTYPSSMHLFDTPFYPLTHNLDQVFESVTEFVLYEDYAYIVDQAFALIESMGDEIAPDYPPEPLPSDSPSADELALADEAREAKLLERDHLIAAMEELLFSIHRSGGIRRLVEDRGYPIHSAIRSRVDGTDQFPDETLVYLYAIMRASQAAMEVVRVLFAAENSLFIAHGAETDDQAGRTLADTRENHLEVYTTLLDDLRRKTFKDEIDTAIHASSLLGEAKSARMLASVYPSLDEAKRERESLRVIQEEAKRERELLQATQKEVKRERDDIQKNKDKKRETSSKGGRMVRPQYMWARVYLEESLWPDIAYDESGCKLSRMAIARTLVNDLLPPEFELQKQRPNPKARPQMPNFEMIYGKGSKKKGWLKNMDVSYDDLPDRCPLRL